ncbi:GNAT family N-acetyltransferase, partial [Streptomyces niveus]
MSASPAVIPATLPISLPAQLPAQLPAPAAAPDPEQRYLVSLARDEEDVRAAQRLRYMVFAGEMGALVDGPAPGLDGDAF